MSVISQQVARPQTTNPCRPAQGLKVQVRGFAGNHTMMMKPSASETVGRQADEAHRPLSEGNQELLQRKCACGGSGGLTGTCSDCEKKKLLGKPLQTKLRVNEPGDAYEQEADRVTEQVLRMPDPAKEAGTSITATAPLVQRKVNANSAGIGTVPPLVYDVLSSPGQPLDATTRAYFEPRFGHDFSQVCVHTDARAAESARAMNALAYTVGPNVVFGVGQYAPKTRVGQQLMAHELTHVVQQGNSPAIFEGGPIFDTAIDTSEREADDVAQNIASSPVRRTARLVTLKPILQRKCGKALGAPNPDCYASSDNVSGEIFYFDVNCDDLKPGEAEHAKKFFAELRPGSMLKIHGFASMEGPEAFNWDLSCHRANKIRSLWDFAMPPVSSISPPSLFKHGPVHDGPAYFRRSVVVEVIAPNVVAPTFTCACDPATEEYYDFETFYFVRSIEPFISSVARAGVPRAAIAGAIADEYNTQKGVKGIVDSIQDRVIDALPEFAIDVDRFFDIHEKLLNTLENDIGPANIKVRTALELIQAGELTVPGVSLSEIQVNRIVEFLRTERGTVETTASVIAKAQRLFGPHLTEHPEELRQAIFVEYYKQGDSYYNKFVKSLRINPNHKVCPGDGGCRFLYNRRRLSLFL